MQESLYFVISLITGSFGLVYAVAMSQGLPVIYTRGQEFDGQVDEGLIGHSVSSQNHNEIAKNIIKIINTYEEKSKNCFNLCSKFN